MYVLYQKGQVATYLQLSSKEDPLCVLSSMMFDNWAVLGQTFQSNYTMHMLLIILNQSRQSSMRALNAVRRYMES